MSLLRVCVGLFSDFFSTGDRSLRKTFYTNVEAKFSCCLYSLQFFFLWGFVVVGVYIFFQLEKSDKFMF